jgi:hypothetical protein
MPSRRTALAALIAAAVLVVPVAPAARAQGTGDVEARIELLLTHAELYGHMWNLGPAGTVVPLRIQSGARTRDVPVKSIDRAAYFKEKKPL